MARIVVTGAGGFIGSRLTSALLEAGNDVVAVDVAAAAPRQRQNLRPIRHHPRLDLHGVDLLDVDLPALLAGSAGVVHLAGQPGVRTSWHDFGRHLDRNVLLTQRVLDAALEVRTGRVVVASSSSVYGEAGSRPSREDDGLRPLHPYGISKAAAEQVADVYARRGVDVACLRYFTVYGPGQRPDMAFRRLIDAALGGPAFPCYASLDRVRDVTYVDDVVAATITTLTADLAPGAVCNVGGGSPVSLSQVRDLLGRWTGRDVPVEWGPSTPGDPRRTSADLTLARRLLGWEPTTGIEVGLRRQLDWQLALAGGAEVALGPAAAG